MATVLIIGDGPAGLSAALLLAKNHQDTVVFGTDTTPLHHAQLGNYLGVESMRGSEFQAMARKQMEAAGARTRDEAVREVLQDDKGFIVRSESAEWHGDYVILAAGKASQRLARQLGIAVGEGRLTVDGDQRTTLDRVYAVGRVTRPERSQAIISAGAGAAAAIDILSRETGRDFHDWDNAPDHDHDHPDL